MKHPGYALLFISLFLLVMMGCADNPSAVVKKYYAALEKKDGETLAEIYTPQFSYFIHVNEINLNEALLVLDALSGLKVDNYSHTIDNNTAVVTVVLKDGEVEKVDLVKLDGKWRVVPDSAIYILRNYKYNKGKEKLYRQQELDWLRELLQDDESMLPRFKTWLAETECEAEVVEIKEIIEDTEARIANTKMKIEKLEAEQSSVDLLSQ